MVRPLGKGAIKDALNSWAKGRVECQLGVQLLNEKLALFSLLVNVSLFPSCVSALLSRR